MQMNSVRQVDENRHAENRLDSFRRFDKTPTRDGNRQTDTETVP